MKLVKVLGDITEIQVDAIVLPANSRLMEGSGVSEAIYKSADREKLRLACAEFTKKFRTIKEGCAVRTPAYDLKEKTGVQHIIHTVVPKWRGGNNDEYAILMKAYLSALELADLYECESVAFPLLASGNNGFDRKLALEIAEKSVGSYTPTNKLKDVCLVIYKKSDAVDEESLSLQKEFSRSSELAVDYVTKILQVANDYLANPEHQKQLLEIARKGCNEIVKTISTESVKENSSQNK